MGIPLPAMEPVKSSGKWEAAASSHLRLPDVGRAMAMMRIMPIAWLLPAFVGMGILHFALPLGRLVAMPWNLAGLLVLLGGVTLNLAADRDFRRAATTVKPFEPSSSLLTRGVFHFSRNPMYLGFILILAGTAWLLRSLSPWLALPPFFLVMDRFYVKHEEEMLAAAFGERWRDYQAATRRWL